MVKHLIYYKKLCTWLLNERIFCRLLYSKTSLNFSSEVQLNI